MLKRNIELSNFDITYITYLPRRAIQGHALADFIAEFTTIDELNDNNVIPPVRWKMYTDGASNDHCSGVGIVLVTPENRSVCYTLKLEFTATNNEAEYEALIADLKIIKELGVKSVEIFSDAQLVVYQVRGDYQARRQRLAPYSV